MVGGAIVGGAIEGGGMEGGRLFDFPSLSFLGFTAGAATISSQLLITVEILHLHTAVFLNRLCVVSLRPLRRPGANA